MLPEVPFGEGMASALLQIALEGVSLRTVSEVDSNHNPPRDVLCGMQ
jgi:hypothetical protein